MELHVDRGAHDDAEVVEVGNVDDSVAMNASGVALGPIIALLTQPLHQTGYYVPASYVKWIEMAGGRVVPLSYHATDAEVDALQSQVNGVLLPGGGGDVPPAARRVWTNAIAAAKAGDHFPVWGTCDGFEWLMQVASGDDGILSQGFDAENASLPLILEKGASESALLSEAAAFPVQGARGLTVLDALAKLNLTMNNHVQGVSPAAFAASAPLTQAFSVLATNVDRAGKPFVSMVEGRRGLPIWATQFHPEKNIFEQGVSLPGGTPYEAIHHSRAAVAVSQYMANFFVDQARLSTRRFRDAQSEWDALIYHAQTTTHDAPAFVQTYEFD